MKRQQRDVMREALLLAGLVANLVLWLLGR